MVQAAFADEVCQADGWRPITGRQYGVRDDVEYQRHVHYPNYLLYELLRQLFLVLPYRGVLQKGAENVVYVQKQKLPESVPSLFCPKHLLNSDPKHVCLTQNLLRTRLNPFFLSPIVDCASRS